MVRLTSHDSVSTETIRRRLDENKLKPWQKKMWCIPKVDAEFVARMEDVLDLYAEEPLHARTRRRALPRGGANPRRDGQPVDAFSGGLDRRIPSKEMLAKEVRAWERRRNRDKSRINWLFT